VNIVFKGRHTDVLDRFRKHATAKLSKIEKLDQKAIRIDVEVCTERNPRQSGRRERVELTISSRGPTIRAEAAAEDRYTALDMAFSKLESRLRRAGDRRKCRHGAHAAIRLIDLPTANDTAAAQPGAASAPAAGGTIPAQPPGAAQDAPDAESDGPSADGVIPIEMEGNGPLVVREKYHVARPMSIDQALFEMELVGHDFFLFHDSKDGRASVVYRRRGYQYGVIRLVEEQPDDRAGPIPDQATASQANGQAKNPAELAAR
jgi:ribosomal subunit interface protein